MQGPPSGKLSCKIVLATSNCLTELLVGCFTWLGWPPLNNPRTLFRPDRRQFVFSFSAPAGWDWAVLSSEQFQFIYKVLCKIVGRSLAVCVLQPGNVWYQFAPAERSRESWAVTRWRSLQLKYFTFGQDLVICIQASVLCPTHRAITGTKGVIKLPSSCCFVLKYFWGLTDTGRPCAIFPQSGQACQEWRGLIPLLPPRGQLSGQEEGVRCEAESDSSIHCPLMCLVTPTDPVWAPSQERITNRRTVIPTLGFTDYQQTLETLSC